MNHSRSALFLAVAVVTLAALAGCGGTAKTGVQTPTSTASVATVVSRATSTGTVSVPVTSTQGTPTLTGEATAFNDATRAAARPACTETLSDHGFMNYSSFEANLECIIPYFTWPPDRHPNLDWVLTQVPQDKDPKHYPYQTGLEYTVISGNNVCAWELTWLDARKASDRDLEAQALHMLTDVIPNFQTEIRGFPSNVYGAGAVSQLRDMAAKAALGDPSAVETDSEGCMAIQWTTGS